MKYMGSKRWMLQNGLGRLLIESSNRSGNIYDPFCGSSVVAWFVAENTNKKVIAGDLQLYSVYLANSVLTRDTEVCARDIRLIDDWLHIGENKLNLYEGKIKYSRNKSYILKNRELSIKSKTIITRAYGGYYFSYSQSKIFDYLLATMPRKKTLKYLCMAGLIEAASYCVAAPGHTAQPMQPTKTGLKYILEAWNRNPIEYIRKSITSLSIRYAKIPGVAKQINAHELIKDINKNDLVFLDPPYSGVHYSRFYHVLETIANNRKINVSGNGRYPEQKERPISEYSKKTTSAQAMNNMLGIIADRGARAIVTFPLQTSSNGLSGVQIREMAKKRFRIKEEIIKGAFSTLGGNNNHRPARQKSEELILLLEPK